MINGISDVAGRPVKTLCSGVQRKGLHPASWNGSNECGRHMTSGIYFYRLRSADGTITTRKMLILK
jgi:flagellar hook assembly protein FlgD